MDQNPSSHADKSNAPGAAAQFLFILWILVVNVLYYLQFLGAFLARFASRIHR